MEVSPSFCRMTGFAADELIGRGIRFPYWPESSPEGIERGLRRIRETGPVEWDLEFRRKNGDRFPVILAGSLMRGQDGEVIGYLGTVKDITDRKRAERRLRRSLAENRGARRRAGRAAAGGDGGGRGGPARRRCSHWWRARRRVLLGAAAGVVARFGPQHGIVMGTWAAGGAPSPEVGRRRAAERRERHRPGLSERRAGADGRLRRPGRGDGEADRRNAIPERRGGPDQGRSRMWGAISALTSLPEPLPAGAEVRLASFAELVALAIANAEARARLAAQAASDPLTGLANHRTFFERLHAEVERARRHGRPLSLVIIDLDHFKRVNDTHGHLAGDGVLVEVAGAPAARWPARRTRWPGSAARSSPGSCPRATRRAAWAAAERARQAIADVPFPGAGRVTMSAGVAELAAGDERQRALPRRRRRPLLGQGPGAGRLRALRPRARAGPRRASRRVPRRAWRRSVRAAARPGPRAARADASPRSGSSRGAKEVWRYLDGDGDAFGMQLGEEVPAGGDLLPAGGRGRAAQPDARRPPRRARARPADHHGGGHRRLRRGADHASRAGTATACSAA